MSKGWTFVRTGKAVRSAKLCHEDSFSIGLMPLSSLGIGPCDYCSLQNLTKRPVLALIMQRRIIHIMSYYE